MKKLIFLILTLSVSFINTHAQEVPVPTDVEVVEENPTGSAAAESAAQSKVDHKSWRRAGLIAAGVAVVVLGIVAVNHNQGKKAD
jgi:hypothetical protein